MRTIRKSLFLITLVLAIFMLGCEEIDGNIDRHLERIEKEKAALEALREAEEAETEKITFLPECELTELDNTVALTVGGVKVSLAEYRHYFLLHKKNFDMGDPSFWVKSPDKKDLLYKNVLSDISSAVAVDITSEKLGVTLSPEKEKELVTDVILGVMSHYNSSSPSFSQVLEESFLTDALYRKLQSDLAKKSVIYDSKYAPGKELSSVDYNSVFDYVNSNYIRVKHVMLGTVDLTSAERTEVRQSAERILELAGKGESFESLISLYNEDSMDWELGYCIRKGDMPEEFEKAAFSLSVGETSGIVETAYGYHVIRRYDIDEGLVMKNTELLSKITDDYCKDAFQKELDSTAACLEVSYSPYFESYLASLWNE